MTIARCPWAGQVAAALASVGVEVSLTALASVSVKEVAAAGSSNLICYINDCLVVNH